MCLKPITEDGSLKDAQGNNVLGFGEVKEADRASDQISVSGFAVGLTSVAHLLKMLLLYRNEQNKDK